tara:strand:- start:907 stop:1869 length:963 start_codon:yes stop_codon:yes gene_type:complete
MGKLLNKIKKYLSKYRYLKIVYKSLTNKGYFYHHIQEYFTNIKVRNFISKFERKIFNLLYKKYYYESNSNLAEKNVKLLTERGVTDKFEIENFENYRDEILNYFSNNKIFFDKKPEEKFFLHNRDPKIKVGYYDSKITAKCPYIFDIINDKNILSTASLYFNSPFKLDYASVWWSFKNEDMVNEKTQFFHRDLDSFNLLKFFVYLTDVDENSGSNQYVLFSHKKNFNKKISRKTFKEEDLEVNLEKNLFTFTGKSGSVIGADTFGFHRGKTPKSKDRLMLVLAFSLIGTFYGPTRPFFRYNEIISKKKEFNKFINKDHLI